MQDLRGRQALPGDENMNIIGTLTYCNRCGFKIFRKGEIRCDPPIYSNIFTDVDPLPNGWIQFNNEHLCPKCAEDWKAAIKPARRNNA
jgi:hypothetical protein